MYTQEKVEQHYVSWYYLKKWRSTAANTQQGIWTRTGDGEPVLAQGRNRLARLDYCYRVEVDSIVSGLMAYKYPPVSHDGFVAAILAELELLANIHSNALMQLRHHERLGIINTNYLENKYDRLEGEFSQTLARIEKRGARWLAGGAAAARRAGETLTHLYATQFFRTPSMRSKVLQTVREVCAETDMGQVVLSPSQTDTLFKLILYIESIQLARQLCRDQVSIVIYESNSSANFFSSNEPAQCISHEVDEQRRFVTYLGIMPLGPSRFMQIGTVGSSPAGIVVRAANASVVAEINAMFLRANNGSDVYATTREALINW